MKDSLRIVVVGDENVGKTSIIEVLITEKFQKDVQPVLPVLVVGRDVTPEHVDVSIVDTPGDPKQVQKVDEELAIGDVIVLVYDVNNDNTTKRILTHWLPKIRAAKLSVPIILVGNKIDTRGGVSNPTAAAKMEEFIKPIMDKFREVDVCIECSAKSVSNISEVFYFAQKAVLYPTGQIYDVETHSLKPPAAAALRRIFKLCDKDGDGGLNDQELNDFQYTCFNVHLQPAELEGVKRVVQENCPMNGLNRDGSLSVDGFIFLHTLFVQKGRLETTWIVTRTFGYDDDMNLTLTKDEKLTVGEDQSVELSAAGKSYLHSLFSAADRDGDWLLSPAENRKFWAECPLGEFASKEKLEGERLTTPADTEGKENYTSLNAMYARWAMYITDSVEDAAISMKYLGFPENVSKAFRVTRSRRRERKARANTRQVMNVAVLGCDGVLKADVIRGLVNMGAQNKDSPHVCAASNVMVPEEEEEEERMLMMRHIPEENMRGLFESRAQLEAVDVMCIVFDGSEEESFEKGRLIWTALESKKPGIKIPVVFVAAVNGTVGTLGSETLEAADAFCLEQGLPTATRISLADEEYGNLYEDLLGVALYPRVGCPDYYASEGGSTMSTVLMVTAGVVATGAAIYTAKRLYDYYTSKPSP